MLNKITIVIGLLMGSILAAWGASSTLSGLPAGTSIAGTDLFYDVQTVGVGGVKVTGTQFLSFVFGQVSGNCTASNAGVFSCTGGNATGIAAGTNISTSGTGTNVTINVISTPTFSSITASFALITGWLTAGGFNAQTATLAGNLTGTSANFSGGVTVSGNLTAPTAQFAGFLTASGVSMQTATIAGNLTGSSANFSTSLTADTLQATGFLSASGANFTSLTVTGLTPTGPVCLQEVNGLIQANNSACSAPQLSIAAGNNISTSGTATNITVNVINNPTFVALTSTAGSFPVQLTAGGASFNTVSIAQNLTGTLASFTNLTATGSVSVGAITGGSVNFVSGTITTLTNTNHWTTNLTATNAGSIAALTGSSLNFVSGTITTLTGTNAWITNLTATGNGSIAALTGSNVNFVSGTITTLTGTNAWLTNVTHTLGSITTLTGSTATFQTVTINSLTPTGPNCLQETGGVVQATNAACGSGGGSTPATGGPLLPSSEYLGGASGQLAPTFYIPTSGVANQGAIEGIGLATTATSTLATAVLQFNMPEIVPTSPMRLRLLYMANANTGNVSTWIQDALTSASASLGVTALTSETTKTISITTVDALIEKKFALTQTPTAGSNQILTVLLNLTTTVGQTVVIQPSIIWE